MFTIEEIALMKMYTGFSPNREKLIQSLKAILPHFTEKEQEMKNLAQGVIRKLMAMNDEQLSKIDFSQVDFSLKNTLK